MLFKWINNTIFKVIIIVLMCLLLILLGLTAYEFNNDNYTEYTLFWHKFAGFVIVLIILIHMIIKKNKIKKLSEEFLNVLLKKEIKHKNNKEYLLIYIKNKSLKEVSFIFNIDLNNMKLFLKKNKIVLHDEGQSISKIAKTNSKDIYQLFILILKLHIESSIQKNT